MADVASQMHIDNAEMQQITLMLKSRDILLMWSVLMVRIAMESLDIDRHIGVRLRERRITLGMTQQQLAVLIGVTYQQLHKYEVGQNRLSAGRLWALAGELGVGMDYFFHGVGEEHPNGSAHEQGALLELCRCFSRIRNPDHRTAICEAIRVLASTAGDASTRRVTG